MEKNRRSVAEEAAAKTSEAMERARMGKTGRSHLEELEDRPHQRALPEHVARRELIKEHPLESALGALSLGFLLTRFLPIRALIGGALRIGWMLLKPMALLYAGAKLAKFYRTLPLREEKRLPD